MSDFGEYYDNDFNGSGKLKKFVEYRRKSMYFDFDLKLHNGVYFNLHEDDLKTNSYFAGMLNCDLMENKTKYVSLDANIFTKDVFETIAE